MATASTPTTCALHVERDGTFTYTKTDDVLNAMKKDATIDFAERFFSVQDDSHKAKDVGKPNNKFARDVLQGPGSLNQVHHLDTAAGLNGGGSAASVDRRRFMKEFAALELEGVCDRADKPDFQDDKSITKFFGRLRDHVHDIVLKDKNAAHLVIDAAPSIYLFSELLNQSGVLIREEFTELWARRVFPVRNFNSWLPAWVWKKFAKRGILPNPVDPTRLPSSAPRSSERAVDVQRPIIFYDHAAAWTNLELLQHAEAVANGAINLRLDQERIDTSVEMMLMREDLYAFFGDTEVDLYGVFSPEADTGIERIPAGTKFGAGSTEDDRELLIREVDLIIRNTETKLAPNTIMLSTDSWLYVTGKRFGTNATDSNQTVLAAAMDTLKDRGVTDVLWVPEVGFSQPQADRLIAHGIQDPGEAQRLAGGLNSQQTMVVLRRDPKVLELVVGKERTMFPARQESNDKVEVRFLQGTGAMAFYQPAGIKIVLDVGPS